MPTSKQLLVSAIKDGTVIDHIPAGQALNIVRILRLVEEKKTVTVGFNLKSQALGYKDLIKVEGRELTKDEVSEVALLAPHASVNIIRNYHIVKKFNVELPTIVEHFVVCPNQKCITNFEPVRTRFRVLQNSKVYLDCTYCEKVFAQDEILDYHL